MSENKPNNDIIVAFNSAFEWKCMSLLTNAYSFVITNNMVSSDCEEEYISAVIFDYIDKCSQSVEWQIDIVPEYRLYKNEILKRKKSAKTAPRIDLRFCGWANSNKLTYFVEAKNLIETGRYKKVTARYLHKRYIKTGIDNYLSGKYPANGCLVGYILQGNTANIVGFLNKLLEKSGRNSEILRSQSFDLCGFNSDYLSKHGNMLSLKHLMFEFV